MALENYETDLERAKQQGDKAGEERAYSKLGLSYYAIGEYEQALEQHKMHLEIAKQLGDKAGEETAYGNLGLCYESIGEYSKAMEHHEMYLEIAKELKDKAQEGKAHCNLGLCCQSTGEYSKALKHHKNHLTIAKQLGDREGEGKAYCNLGNCYESLGEYDKAFKHHQMDLDIAKQLGDKEGEGMAYGNLGNYYNCIGEYYKAVEHHQLTLNIAKQLGNRALQGKAHSCLGNCYDSMGEYDKAFQHHEKSLEITKQLGDKAVEGSAYCNLGNCYDSIGEYDKAFEYYEMALSIAKQLGDKEAEGKAYCNLGNCYHRIEDYDKALKHYEMHLAITEELGDKAGEGMAHGNLGNCYDCIGEYRKALEHQKMDLDIAKELGDKAGEGTAYGNLGNCYQSVGEYSKAIDHHKLHLTMAKQLGDKEGEGRAHHNLGCCYALIGQDEHTEYHGRKSLGCLENLFDHTPKDDQFKTSIRETFVSTHRLLMRSLLFQGKLDEALVIAERGRARALTYLMSNNFPRQFTEPSASNALELCDIRKIVKALDTTVLFFTTDIGIWVIPPTGDVTFKEITMHVSSQGNVASKNPFVEYLESKIRNGRQFLTSSRRETCEDRSLSCFYKEEMSQQLQSKPDPVLAYSESSPEITDPQAEMLRGERLSSASSQQARMCWTSFAGRLTQDEYESLATLYQTILEPVRQFVDGPRVVIVPDGPLPFVPFAALVDKHGHYVAESLQVRLMPSLTIAKMITAVPQELEGDNSNPLIVGDPRVSLPGVPKLPWAKMEAEIVGKALHVEPLIAETATKDAFLQRIDSANLIHIAAHGDMERGEILLAPNPSIPEENIRKEDVMLTISELERKRLRATLVVLSCCHSGRGEVKAEGVIGIARAFLGAGARAVLVALWALDDRATLYFMEEFYKHLIAGERLNEALNNTMRTMRSHEIYWHPYYWAPFVLIGDDGTPFPKKKVKNEDTGKPTSK